MGKRVRHLALRTKVSRGLGFGLATTVLSMAILTGMNFTTQVTASAADENLIPTTGSTRTIAAEDYDLDYEHAPMPDLKVTVSQTADLTSQGISISWTGGKKSVRPSADNGGENFLQIAQCWGDDPNHPGHPDRTTCVYGGLGSTAAGRSDVVTQTNFPAQDLNYTIPKGGPFSPAYTSIPFVTRTGEIVTNLVRDAEGKPKSRNYQVDMGNNEFFTKFTTNEIPWVGSSDSGEGSTKFEVQTSMQTPALGCGEAYTDVGVTKGKSCWLVVLPRGIADNGEPHVTKSGLFWDAWQHHIAFKLNFRPVGVRCEIGSAERVLAGSELANQAISSWQPQLCLGKSGSAFVVSNQYEPDALDSASSNTASALALTSSPLDAAADPMVYAPIVVTGLSVSFAIDRSVNQLGTVPKAILASDRLPITSMNLTPRLVAKLLTASYIEALPPEADLTYIGYKNPIDPGPNAYNLTRDPEFLAINDMDWQFQNIHAASVADLLLPNGRTDAIYTLWQYVMSDRAAVDFMNGNPDPWGMKVNPWYCLDPKINPTGSALTLPRFDLPKSDPVERPDTTKTDLSHGTGALNLVTWRPYISDFETGAYQVLRGDGLILGGWDNMSNPPKFTKSVRKLQGEQSVMALTTTGAAAKYQTISASLLNPAGKYVKPTRESMAAAAVAMVPTKNPQVLFFDFASSNAKKAKNAYPLTIPVYAAINPQQTDVVSRLAYASMIRYAATSGQIPGSDLGQLPDGYAPLPSSWVQQSEQKANLIQSGLAADSQTAQPTTAATPMPEPTSIDGTGGVISGNPQKMVVGPTTPNDPELVVTTNAVPMSLGLGICVSVFYPLFSKRRA